MSQVQQQEGTQERLRETKFAILIGPKEAEAQNAKRSQGEVLRERTQQEDREGKREREREPVSKCFYWGLGWSTQAKSARGFHWCVSMSVGDRQKKENLWQGPTLSYLLTWAGCSEPIGGDAEAAGKNEVLKFTIQLGFPLWYSG